MGRLVQIRSRALRHLADVLAHCIGTVQEWFAAVVLLAKLLWALAEVIKILHELARVDVVTAVNTDSTQLLIPAYYYYYYTRLTASFPGQPG